MPAFSFEKISSPEPSAANTAAEKKQRGVIVQILDRLAERRGRRSRKGDQSTPVEPKSK